MTLRPFTSTPLVLFKSSTMSSRALLQDHGVVAAHRLRIDLQLAARRPADAGAAPQRKGDRLLAIDAHELRHVVRRPGGAAAGVPPRRSMLVCNRPSTLALLLALRSSRRINKSRSSSCAARALEVRAQRAVLLGQLLQAHDFLRELFAQALEVRLHGLDRPPRLVEVRHEHRHLFLMGLGLGLAASRFAPRAWQPPPPRPRPTSAARCASPPACERSSATFLARTASSFSSARALRIRRPIWARSSPRARSTSCASCAFFANAAASLIFAALSFSMASFCSAILVFNARGHVLQPIAFGLQRPAPALRRAIFSSHSRNKFWLKPPRHSRVRRISR